jgi:CRISPR/Cas system-associated endonuclease Cas1
MMEPFRPLIADSAVLTAINKGQVRPTDFIVAASNVNLTNEGRKRFLGVLEQRLNQEVTHPQFGYRASYRRILEIQARLLGRHLMGELPDFPGFVTR